VFCSMSVFLTSLRLMSVLLTKIFILHSSQLFVFGIIQHCWWSDVWSVVTVSFCRELTSRSMATLLCLFMVSLLVFFYVFAKVPCN
jgi:hypothetical protein